MRRGKIAAMAAMAAGRKRVDAGDIRGAIRLFDRAVAVDVDCAQAYLYRAGLKLLTGDLDGAIADFRALPGLDHSFLPAYRDLTTLSAEEFPALIPAAQTAVRRAPDCAWAWVFRAFSLRSLMRYEEAIGDLDRAVALEPKSAALWAMRSRVKLTNRQDFYDGVRDMAKAVALAPEWGWINCWLGEALRHQGEFKRALAALDKGLTLEPGYLRGWAWRGGVKVALGDFRGARRDLDKSLAWDPIYSYDFEYTYDQKAWACDQRQIADRGPGRYSSRLAGPRTRLIAAARATRGSSIPRSDPRRSIGDGLAELDAYLKVSPRDSWAWAWRGWTLHESARDEEALESLARARRLAPSAAWPAAWEGQGFVGVGPPARRRRALSPRRCVRDPSYAPAWGWRAESRRRLGDLRGAGR